MKQITFLPETYVERVINQERIDSAQDKKEKKALVCTNEYKVGLFEMIDIMLNRLSNKKCDKKEHRITKRLKKKLKEISRYKDVDEDARVLKEGTQILLIEEDEYNILKEHLESATPSVTARASELVDDLWTLIDGAVDFIPKPILMKETPLAIEGEGQE